ncbi:general substrate transporter, partial [Chytriomyces sp. MP71]
MLTQKTWQGTFASIFIVGGAIGSMLGGSITDWLGRKRALFLSNLPYIWASIFLASSNSPTGLCVGRFLAGLASGVCAVVLPMYLAEIAPIQYRGSL